MLIHLPLLVSLASAQGEPPPWWAWPTVDEFHPVRWIPAVRLYELTVGNMAGDEASPLFREPLARTAVYFRLQDHTGTLPWISTEDLADIQALAFSGISMGLEDLILEMIDRSDWARTTFAILRTPFSPSLNLTRSDDRIRLRVNRAPLSARPGLAFREEITGLPPRPGPPSGLAISGGLSVSRTDDPSGEDQDAGGAYETDYTVNLVARDLVIDLFQVSGRVIHQTWQMSARNTIVEPISGTLYLQSTQGDALPDTWGLGLSRPIPNSRNWSTGVRYRQDFHLTADLLPGDWEVSWYLRFLPSNPSLTGPGTWPLGQRLGKPGPWWPDLKAGKPLETRLHTTRTPDGLLDVPQGLGDAP